MDIGLATVAERVANTWHEAYASQLAPKTQMRYEQILAKQVLPPLGALELRAITPETIARWQSTAQTAWRT